MRVPIDSIVVGERRRQDLGDLTVLADSIARWGLIHPIVVDDARHLIAGGRRLEACKRLGWTAVEVRSHGVVGANDRVELELEENTQRKDLTALEASRNMLERAVLAEQTLLQQAPAVTDGGFDNRFQNPVGGRPSKGPVPEQAIAERLGVTRPSLRNAQAHVAAVARYAELDHPRVGQQEAIRLAAELDAMPEEQRAQVLGAVHTRSTPRERPPRPRQAPPPKRPPPQRRPRRRVTDLPSMAQCVKALLQLETALAALDADGGLWGAIRTWPEAERTAQLAELEGLIGRLMTSVAQCKENG